VSYATVLAGVLAVGRAGSGFSVDNFAYEDYQPLNAGVDKLVVVEFAGFKTEEDTFGGLDWHDWTFRLKLYTFAGDYVTSVTDRDSARAVLISQFRKYRRLNGVSGVFDAQILSGERLDEPIRIGESSFIMEAYTLKVREEAPVEALE
jgi:hypothetical protein